MTNDPICLATTLFAQLSETLGLMVESMERRDNIHILQHQQNAQAILGDLNKKLNFEVAGDMEQTLRLLYSEASKRIQREGRESCVERIDSAREMIGEIEKAWVKIARRN
ncbi:flagellar protein FliS [Parasphingorhabdus sp.]|uniref:flagellar protein FliS n=1 Tax=Parasphingorhabdus sp. TaxID=2709688 RepID=UPI003D267DB3